jgi:PadR family transcriptional regulator PadR
MLLLTPAINYYLIVIDGSHLLEWCIYVYERSIMNVLTRAEEILLLSILRLKNNAYAPPIIREIKKSTGKELTIGSLWVSLDSLRKKGFVDKRMAEEKPAKGGRKKVFYSLTSSGAKALRNAREFQKSLWNGVEQQLKKIEVEEV